MKKIIFFILVALFTFCTTSAFAQIEYNYISDIEITGNINVTTQLIKSASGLALGQIYSTDKIAKAIQNIYKLGLFSDIQVDKFQDDKGVKIIILVSEYPIIQDWEITGNKKIRLDDIKKKFRLIRGDYWSGERQLEIKNKILELYYSKGYRLAAVNFKEEPALTNRIELTILINEGYKVVIKEINFTGNEQVTDKKLRKIIKTKKSGFLRSGEFDQEKFDEDLIRIVGYYNSKGYIDAAVIGWEPKYDENGQLFISIDLYEGNQYRIGDISIEGNTLFSKDILLHQLKFEKDEIFNREEFDEKLNGIRSMYYEEGYIYSTVSPQIKPKGEMVNINIFVQENNRAKVRQIYINGNKKTKEKIIRRQLAIVPGDYFRQSLLIQSQRNIYNLGFFEPNIGLDYQPINDEGDIDLIFELEDKESGTANMGVNYDEKDKLTGFLALSHNNLFGQAWGLRLSWEFSGSKQEYDISFTNPYFYDTNILVGADVYHQRNNWNDYNYRVIKSGGGFRVGTRIPWVNYAKVTTGYSITQKEYSILDENDDVSSSLRALVDKGKILTSTAFLTLERDDRDNVFRPSEGSLVRSYTEFAGGILGGRENYIKEIIQTNWYLKLFWKFSLGMRFRVGYVKAFGDTDEVPPDELFYPGGTGADGIRGYSDNSIVPEDKDGGNAEFITSSEITFPISGDQIIGVMFFDAGNSYNYLSEINVQKLKKGIGMGVRIMSPMGLLGFDYAYGLDRKEKNKWQFHFQFGSTF
ncbi:MAG: outer membrane protein assembly factor BamA [Candidatus Cloacimonetes bacterium]|nr:outer membrane protein assembly factor BamA [Candidatus Cloacimonadota bacterium]